ncbi:hypothetical protein [Hyphomicrobium zavarzinii]|uniref:hypothetical protein n=1 Tax=Hyphomicrobium zavarzinii TaxID=48292 RepID=UPI00039CBF82|nr:hypothetical protein [Hyphomicrobium zavarzinii]
MNELKRYYLNNEPWLTDDAMKVFQHEMERSKRLRAEELSVRGVHLASLKVVLIKGYPYYHDERLKEFRRVGGPHMVLTYQQFELLDEKDQRLIIPTGDAFKKAMAKERAFWRREKERHADSDRGE